MKHARWWLAAILVLAFALRAAVAAVTFNIPFDSGTVGLMALHILEGERPLFLYGHPYSGALLAYLVAIAFKLGGVNMATFVAPTLLFSMGTVWVTYLLFREWFDEKAGLAAALVVAVPDWISLWYGFAPDCSYSPIFFLGAMILLLATRVGSRELSPRSEWAHILGLGLVSGLGLWTHLLIAVYLLVGAVLLLPLLARRRLSISLVARFLAGGMVMGLCLLPNLTVRTYSEGNLVTTLYPVWPIIQMHWANLLERGLPWIYTWPVQPPQWIREAVRWSLLLGLALYLLRLFMPNSRKDGLRAAVPMLFSLLFLALYLPHRRALVAAPRYILPLWTMAIQAMTAVPIASTARVMRAAGGVLLALYTGYNLLGAAAFVRARSEPTDKRLASYEAVLLQARDAGSDVVTLVGNVFDFKPIGQILSFLARDEISFVSFDEERYQPAAQQADAALRPGFLVQLRDQEAVGAALDALHVGHEETVLPPFVMFDSVALPSFELRSISPDEITIECDGAMIGEAGSVLDRNSTTFLGLRLGRNAGVTLDLGRERRLAGVALLPLHLVGDTLPEQYVLEVSLDGTTYREVQRHKKAWAFRYLDGNGIFFSHAYGRQECRFPPVQARFVRYRADADPAPPGLWRISELMLFEEAGERSANGAGREEEALHEIADMLEEEGVRFTAADRRLSAALWAVMGPGGRGPAFARYNDHEHAVGVGAPPPPRRFRPGPGRALAVAHAVADEQEAVLGHVYGDALTFERTGIGPYALFLFRSTLDPREPDLAWNGLMALP